MRVPKPIVLTVLGLAFLANGAVWGAEGFHYKATTTTTGDRMKQPDVLEVEAWVEGPSAKIVFIEAGKANPFLSEGNYLLTTDGGETIYLVDPEKNTHSRFDLGQLAGIAGSMSDSGMFEMDISDYSVEELERGDGPSILDRETDYYKYLTSYTLEMNVMGMKRADEFVLEQEMWVVDGLDAAGFQAWMRPRKTGFEAVDTMLEGELEKVKGFPFKTVTITRSVGTKKKKRSMNTVSTTEVTEFSETNVADSTFELDPDSREISMIPNLADVDNQDNADEEPEEEEKGGMFKRLKKLRKGGGR